MEIDLALGGIVALIAAVVSAILWFARLESKVNQNKADFTKLEIDTKELIGKVEDDVKNLYDKSSKQQHALNTTAAEQKVMVNELKNITGSIEELKRLIMNKLINPNAGD